MPAGKQDDGKQPSFKVSDRRSFVETGEPVTEAAGEASSQAKPDTTTVAAADTPPEVSRAATDDSGPLPPVDFHTFVLSLGSSALLHLGELDRPDGADAQPDLRLAKHTIDIIGMLQEKTRGNLSPPEERLIESLLYDLRLRYVERGK